MGKTDGPAAKQSKSGTNWEGTEWGSKATTQAGQSWQLKVTTWNVSGLRACVSKGGAELLARESPDILCLQETKCSQDKLPPELLGLANYPHCYWLAAEKDGYSGVGLMCRTEPLSVQFGFPAERGGEQHNAEGRLITAEFQAFYLVTTYVPNAGRGLVTLDKRMDWDPLLRQHCQELDKKKPVILCGDMNVAHQEIDLKNPKTNKKNAGFTQEERDGFSDLLEAGFVDAYRHLYPEEANCYTFWTYMMNCRAKNVGWRLDYFLVSQRLLPRLADCIIRSEVMGSDHCPLSLLLANPQLS